MRTAVRDDDERQVLALAPWRHTQISVRRESIPGCITDRFCGAEQLVIDPGLGVEEQLQLFGLGVVDVVLGGGVVIDNADDGQTEIVGGAGNTYVASRKRCFEILYQRDGGMFGINGRELGDSDSMSILLGLCFLRGERVVILTPCRTLIRSGTSTMLRCLLSWHAWHQLQGFTAR